MTWLREHWRLAVAAVALAVCFAAVIAMDCRAPAPAVLEVTQDHELEHWHAAAASTASSSSSSSSSTAARVRTVTRIVRPDGTRLERERLEESAAIVVASSAASSTASSSSAGDLELVHAQVVKVEPSPAPAPPHLRLAIGLELARLELRPVRLELVPLAPVFTGSAAVRPVRWLPAWIYARARAGGGVPPQIAAGLELAGEW